MVAALRRPVSLVWWPAGEVILDGVLADEELRSDLAFDKPSTTSPAICASCGVSWSWPSPLRSPRRRYVARLLPDDGLRPVAESAEFLVTP
jgi:hypothetical protein